MATQSEKLIQSLSLEVEKLKQRVEVLYDERRLLTDLARQHTQTQTELAVVQAQLAQLTKTRDLWGQRGWAVFTVAVSAVFSLFTGTATALVAFYLNSKK